MRSATSRGMPVFAGGALVALFVALMTVGLVSARAASVNPMHSLRYE